jgi:hypothetical protein
LLNDAFRGKEGEKKKKKNNNNNNTPLSKPFELYWYFLFILPVE